MLTIHFSKMAFCLFGGLGFLTSDNSIFRITLQVRFLHLIDSKGPNFQHFQKLSLTFEIWAEI